MYHKCVIETKDGLVVITSRPGHTKGCIGHVANGVNKDDYKFLKRTGAEFVVCKDRKLKYVLEKMNEPVSE